MGRFRLSQAIYADSFAKRKYKLVILLVGFIGLGLDIFGLSLPILWPTIAAGNTNWGEGSVQLTSVLG